MQATDKEALWKDLPIALDRWILAHNAIRDEIAAFKETLATIGERKLQPWEREVMKAWWKGHATHTHNQHQNEDDRMMPLMATRIQLPSKLTEGHVDLIVAMDKVEKLVNDTKLESVARLRLAVDEYEAVMLPHLRVTESIALPLLRAHFTPKEVNAKVGEILQQAPPIASGAFWYWACGGDKQRIMAFMAQEGTPWFVYYITMKPRLQRYRKEMSAPLETLRDGRASAAIGSGSTWTLGRLLLWL